MADRERSVSAPLHYAGPTQVNSQAPSNVPVGTGRVGVRLGDTAELRRLADIGGIAGAFHPWINETPTGLITVPLMKPDCDWQGL